MRWPLTPFGTVIVVGGAALLFPILNYGFWWSVRAGGDMALSLWGPW